jgi:hypothetical protein
MFQLTYQSNSTPTTHTCVIGNLFEQSFFPAGYMTTERDVGLATEQSELHFQPRGVLVPLCSDL